MTYAYLSKASPFTLSHGVQRRPHTYQKMYRLLFQNQILLLTLTVLSSAFCQILSSNSFLLQTIHLYRFPPFHTTIQTSEYHTAVFFTRYYSLFLLNFWHKCSFWSFRYNVSLRFVFFPVAQAIFSCK